MGREVTVAYENQALERASRRGRKAKLKWHRADGGGLKSSGERGEYCIVRQRADRRHGIYRWGVTHNGHSVGSTEDLAGAKGLAAHHEFKQSCAETTAPSEVPGAAENRGRYRAQFIKSLRLMGESDPEGFANRHEQDVERYELAGVEPNIAAAILMSSRHHRDLEVAENSASESPTRGEWEVVVTNPPREHRGHILSMAGPGYGHAEGNKIYLTGFYDDEEARHVANSISRKYRSQVTYGPRRKMEAAEDSHPGAALEERRRRPGAEPKEEPPCEHGCPTGECKPFTKLSRDPRAFDACMKRAKEIGELDTSRKLYDLIHHELGSQDREVFGVVCIDFRGQLRDFVILSVGQRHRVAVDIEDILQVVILSGSDGFAVCHSHPSGNAEPSQADRQLTKSIEKAAAVACPNIKLVDHIVVGNGNFYSFADKKLYKVR
jgi:proteasome lid subunit RPN8/RPN11